MIKFIITGDFCPINRTETLIKRKEFDKVFNNTLSVLQDNDFAITNLETPLTYYNKSIPKTGPNLRALPNSVELLKYGGFNIAALANNHILDFGNIGLEDTFKCLNSNGIKYVGAGKNILEAENILYLNIKSKKISIINIAENEFSIADYDSGGANPLNPISNYYKIIEAKKKTDFLIVYIHGGNENYNLPNPYLVKLCRFFADLGADLITVSHSHHPSGFEVYNKVPIFYGLGNFIFDMPKPPTSMWNYGYLVKFTLDDKTTFEIIPYEQFKEGNLGVKLLENSEKEKFLDYINSLSQIIANDIKLNEHWKNYIKSNIGLTYSTIFQFNPILKRIVKIIGLRKSKKNKERLLSLLNMLICESHYLLLKDGIKEILNYNYKENKF